LQTRRLAESFEGLNLSSTINWLVAELQIGKKMQLNPWFQSTSISYNGSNHVNYI